MKDFKDELEKSAKEYSKKRWSMISPTTIEDYIAGAKSDIAKEIHTKNIEHKLSEAMQLIYSINNGWNIKRVSDFLRKWDRQPN